MEEVVVFFCRQTYNFAHHIIVLCRKLFVINVAYDQIDPLVKFDDQFPTLGRKKSSYPTQKKHCVIDIYRGIYTYTYTLVINTLLWGGN